MSVPVPVRFMIQKQLKQLNCIKMPSITKGAVLNLQGDQYRAYTIITKSISAFRHIGQLFFVTGPGGTGKSFLLKAL